VEPVAEQVRCELRRLSRELGALDAVVEAWPAVVGETIARNAWPARATQDGTLHVAASSAVWAFELGQLAPTILDRLREVLGEATPRALRFAVGHVPEPAAAAESASAQPSPWPEPDAETLTRARDLASSVENEELRERVARAAALSLARSGSGRAL